MFLTVAEHPRMQDLVAGRIDYLTTTTFAPLACAPVKTMLTLLKDPSFFCFDLWPVFL
jgi:hypothetical protein